MKLVFSCISRNSKTYHERWGAIWKGHHIKPVTFWSTYSPLCEVAIPVFSIMGNKKRTRWWCKTKTAFTLIYYMLMVYILIHIFIYTFNIKTAPFIIYKLRSNLEATRSSIAQWRFIFHLSFIDHNH